MSSEHQDEEATMAGQGEEQPQAVPVEVPLKGEDNEDGGLDELFHSERSEVSHPNMTAPSTPSSTASGPRKAFKRHNSAGNRGSLLATPTGSRRHSMDMGHNTPAGKPQSGGPSTSAGSSAAGRRKMSTKLLDRMSIFESGRLSNSSEAPLHSLLSPTKQHSSERHLEPGGRQSPSNHGGEQVVDDLTAPTTPLSALSRSNHSRRNSKAMQLIQQFNQKAAGRNVYKSPAGHYHNSPKEKLLSPKEVKELVRLSGGSYVEDYVKMSPGLSPKRKLKLKAAPFIEYDLEHEESLDPSERQLDPETPLLSAKEVKALIRHNNKSKIFQKLVSAYEGLGTGATTTTTTTTTYKNVAEKELLELKKKSITARFVGAKSRQRKYNNQKLKDTVQQSMEDLDIGKEPEQENLDTNAADTAPTRKRLPPAPPTSASRIFAAAAAATPSTSEQRDEEEDDVPPVTPNVHKSIRNAPLDMSTFQPAQFLNKTEEQHALIEATVEDNFVFKEFRKNGKARLDKNALGALLNAFEPIVADAGEQIQTKLQQAAATDASNEEEAKEEHFYIVQEGQVDIHIDGRLVGTAVKGDCFGEQALLHPSLAGNTTLIAGTNELEVGTGDGKTRLLRLDHKSFRGILQVQVTEATEAKRKMLQSIDFLQQLLAEDERLVHPLAMLLQRHEFVKGEQFMVNEESTFIMVQRGALHLSSSGDDGFQSELREGQYFGERALLGTLPSKSRMDNIILTGMSDETGVYYSMDRIALERALGANRLEQLQDWSCFNDISSMEMLLAEGDGKNSKIKKYRRGMLGAVSPRKTRGRLAERIRRKRFDQGHGQDILEDETPDEPALYVVREGTALVTYTDDKGQTHEKTVGVGEVFGDEHLAHGTDTKRPANYSAKTAGDGPVSVGILPIKEVQRVKEELQDLVEEALAGDHEEEAPAREAKHKDPTDVAVYSTASIRLQQKIRQAVHANIRLEDLEKLSVLGEGQFGEVWLVAADVFQTGVDSLKQRFALKSQFMTDDTRGDDAMDAIRREIDILESLTESSPHPGIVNLVNIYEDKECIYMLMALIPGGELWSRIHREDSEGNWSSGIPEDACKFYTYVVADTLGFIHAQNILFRDLKPENIMLDEDGYPILVDFGFAKRIKEGEKTFTFCGTPNYVAPEIILHSGHDKSVDYWALGVTMYEMLAGENPFYYDGLDQVSLYDAICRECFYAYPKDKQPSAAMLDMTHQLLAKEPSQRFGCLAGGFLDILNHRWFADCWTLAQIRTKQVPAPWKPHSDKDETGEHADEEELDEEAMEDLMATFAAPLGEATAEEELELQNVRRNFLMAPSLSSDSSFGIAAELEEELKQEAEEDSIDHGDFLGEEEEMSLEDVSDHPMEEVEHELEDEEEEHELQDEPHELDAVAVDVHAKDADELEKSARHEEAIVESGGGAADQRRGSVFLSPKLDVRRHNPRLTKRAKQKVKNERRSTILGALSGLGLGDSQEMEFDLGETK